MSRQVSKIAKKPAGTGEQDKIKTQGSGHPEKK